MSNGLFGPSGKPVNTGPKGLVVLKVYNANRGAPPPQLLQAIGQMLNSHVIILPTETELLLGRIAKEEVERLHESIHRLLKIMKEEETNTG